MDASVKGFSIAKGFSVDADGCFAEARASAKSHSRKCFDSLLIERRDAFSLACMPPLRFWPAYDLCNLAVRPEVMANINDFFSVKKLRMRFVGVGTYARQRIPRQSC